MAKAFQLCASCPSDLNDEVVSVADVLTCWATSGRIVLEGLPFPSAAVAVKEISLLTSRTHFSQRKHHVFQVCTGRGTADCSPLQCAQVLVCSWFTFGWLPSASRIARRQNVMPDVAWDSNTSRRPPTAFIKDRS